MSDTIRNASSGVYASARRGGVDAWEIEFIQQKREAGVSDFAIANMLARPMGAVQAVPLIARSEPINPYPPKKLKAPQPITPRKPPVKTSGRLPPRGMPERVKRVAAEVAKRHGLTLKELIGDGKKARVSLARQEAFAMIRELRKPTDLRYTYSLSTIGAWFGGRDHSTVLHGVNAHWVRAARAEGEAA